MEKEILEHKKEKSEEKYTTMKNRQLENQREHNEKLKQWNHDFRKKDHIKRDLDARIESDAMTLKEINRLR